MNKTFSLLTAVMVAGLMACGNKEKSDSGQLSPDLISNPATGSTASGDEGTVPLPEFSFEYDQHHFGVITQGEKVSYGFKFKNTGKAPLIISSASASCGCTIPEYTKDPVQPGDEGYINVTFNSEGKAGMVSKTVTVIANTIPNTKVLTISAEIQVPGK
ncbi:MAG TPA: DUF1573 domain-containing protein [Bacteroidia bacterium]|nr:DUF1573 domain-containing protein [Bacteroidia bacterium]